MRRPVSYLLFFCLSGMLGATSAKWTEHRRALLVHIGDDKAHAEKIRQLEKNLQSKGFVTQLIGKDPKSDGVTYEKWVRSIPTMGVSVFYYLGRLETEKSPDGKSVCHSMQLGGYKVLPPARDPSLGRSRAEDKPWLSLERLSQKLNYNVARANLVVIDCLGIDDKAKTGKSKADLFAQASGQFRGELFSSFYPGKAAFHPSLEAPSYGPFMADELIKSLQEDGPLTPRIDKLGYTVTPRDKTFELKHEAAEVCSPPEALREGRFAGDQWVDQNGFCFVWCPAGTSSAWETKRSRTLNRFKSPFRRAFGSASTRCWATRPTCSMRVAKSWATVTRSSCPRASAAWTRWLPKCGSGKNTWPRKTWPTRVGPMIIRRKRNGNMPAGRVAGPGTPRPSRIWGSMETSPTVRSTMTVSSCTTSTPAGKRTMDTAGYSPPLASTFRIPGAYTICWVTWLSCAPPTIWTS